MQKTQIDQYDMLLTVENHFDDNPTLWNANVPVTAAKTLLSAKIDAIATEVALQLVNPTGITIDKANLRTDLENKGYVLSAALSGYASATPNKTELYNRVHFAKSDFPRFREAELIGIITNLHRDATAELANLAPYGVTAAILTALLNANNAFGVIMKNPNEAIARRKSATDKIADLLPDVLLFLETRLDNLIVGLTTAQPQFVTMYSSLRALNSTATNPLSLTITTLEAVTNLPIANVNIELVGEGITRVSSDRGYNTVQNLVSGNHQLGTSHPNFVSQTIPFTVVSGETTELVVVLERI
ncbi:MAG: hypothetical protein V4548_07970 [Bacteroidota bacterium]